MFLMFASTHFATHMALQVAHRGYVLETGRIVLEDTAQNLFNNQQVKEAYLGG
jgi:branched-chain amino acid transport system ATP-binding protein